MSFEYQYLSIEERQHFLEHGWLLVKGAIKEKYLKEWMENIWIRLGWKEDDKSTWTDEYLKLPRHREVRAEEFCPKAWQKMVEIVGGEDKIMPNRERYFGDQMICNFGSEELVGKTHRFQDLTGWHHDNDWYRQFLDSSGNALTIINCFTDVLPEGGGTAVCEDGIQGICQTLYEHPEGIDPPFGWLYAHVKHCNKFYQVEAQAGDVIITHGLLPHAHSPNHKHYARVITNPHVNLSEPWNLNRPDGDYTLCEQVILRALNRTSIPEYKPTRPRISFYPRTAFYKREKVRQELQRMVQDAESRGLTEADVDSVYLRGADVIREHEARNGYDQPFGPTGVAGQERSQVGFFLPERMGQKHVVV